jgi:hypothetical protein
MFLVALPRFGTPTMMARQLGGHLRLDGVRRLEDETTDPGQDEQYFDGELRLLVGEPRRATRTPCAEQSRWNNASVVNSDCAVLTGNGREIATSATGCMPRMSR